MRARQEPEKIDREEKIERGEKIERQVEGMVLELLPSAGYLVELDNRARVRAHAAPATRANFSRLRPKDRVLLELSPHDPTRGRIMRLLSESR